MTLKVAVPIRYLNSQKVNDRCASCHSDVAKESFHPPGSPTR